MKSMNGVPPVLEHIVPSFNQSFTIRVFEESEPNLKPFWHYHPEIELVYIKTGSAKRHIGHHVSTYKNGDLILLGPNLPHYGFTERLSGRRSEIVVQMKPDFLGDKFFGLPESKLIEQLFTKAESGIVFHGETKQIIGGMLEELAAQPPFERMIGLLKALHFLAQSDEFEILHTTGPTLVYKQQDNDKIERVYSHVKEHFKDLITLEDISTLVSMEVPSFCRYFKRVTGKTFTVFVNDFRISHACKLLAETNMSVSEICFESGFNNSSHFNRLFKNITGKTPHVYREAVEHVLA